MDTIKVETLNVKNVPSIEGLVFRRYHGASDHPELIALHNAIYEHADIEERETPDEFDLFFANLRNCNPHEDMIIAEVEDKIIASGRVAWSEEFEGDYIYAVNNSIHPEWEDSGLPETIQHWLEKRARQISTGHPQEAEKYFQSWTTETQKAKIAMLHTFGYEASRYFLEMFRDLSEPIPDGKLPPGLEVHPVKPEHYRPIWEGANEAFRDHWGHVEGTEEDYQRFLKRIEEVESYDPALWMVAWDGEEVAGMVLNKIIAEENEALGIRRGWTDPICVRRQWRRRGLATALVYRSMQMLKDKGMDQAGLGVDTINPSGALKLYQNCGYRTAQKWITYRKRLNL
ncbi:MAG: GNAT family N-acetyltransferase [Anaerolineales bacterium]|jgi:predicted N-acetyltransferase YhbS